MSDLSGSREDRGREIPLEADPANCPLRQLPPAPQQGLTVSSQAEGVASL